MYVREAVKERILLLKEKEIAYITLELENVEPTCSSFSSLKHVLSFLNWSKMAHKDNLNSSTRRE